MVIDNVIFLLDEVVDGARAELSSMAYSTFKERGGTITDVSFFNLPTDSMDHSVLLIDPQ